MDKAAIDEAARLLAEARRSGSRLERLPEGNRPANFAEAYAIELACLSAIGDTLAGWKVSVSRTEGVMMGLLVRSRVFGSGARIPSVLFSMRAIEAEIAFQFEQALPPRAAPYSRDEVAAAAIGAPAMEIVDTRFQSFDLTPAFDRAADFMANGALVMGPARRDWREFDFARTAAHIAINGREVVRRVGGHPSRDPLTPAIALVNHLRLTTGVAEGMIVTTGSFTGMHFAPQNCAVAIGFDNFGQATCDLI